MIAVLAFTMQYSSVEDSSQAAKLRRPTKIACRFLTRGTGRSCARLWKDRFFSLPQDHRLPSLPSLVQRFSEAETSAPMKKEQQLTLNAPRTALLACLERHWHRGPQGSLLRAHMHEAHLQLQNGSLDVACLFWVEGQVNCPGQSGPRIARLMRFRTPRKVDMSNDPQTEGLAKRATSRNVHLFVHSALSACLLLELSL